MSAVGYQTLAAFAAFLAPLADTLGYRHAAIFLLALGTVLLCLAFRAMREGR